MHFQMTLLNLISEFQSYISKVYYIIIIKIKRQIFLKMCIQDLKFKKVPNDFQKDLLKKFQTDKIVCYPETKCNFSTYEKKS